MERYRRPGGADHGRSVPHRQDALGHKPVDRCLAPFVQALNDAGLLTGGCCCGHGKPGQEKFIGLHDGTVLTFSQREPGTLTDGATKLKRQMAELCVHGRLEQHKIGPYRRRVPDPHCGNCKGKGYTSGHSGSDAVSLDCYCIKDTRDGCPGGRKVDAVPEA